MKTIFSILLPSVMSLIILVSPSALAIDQWSCLGLGGIFQESRLDIDAEQGSAVIMSEALEPTPRAYFIDNIRDENDYWQSFLYEGETKSYGVLKVYFDYTTAKVVINSGTKDELTFQNEPGDCKKVLGITTYSNGPY